MWKLQCFDKDDRPMHPSPIKHESLSEVKTKLSLHNVGSVYRIELVRDDTPKDPKQKAWKIEFGHKDGTWSRSIDYPGVYNTFEADAILRGKPDGYNRGYGLRKVLA